MKQRQSRGLMPWILTLLCAVLLTVWVLGSMPAAFGRYQGRLHLVEDAPEVAKSFHGLQCGQQALLLVAQAGSPMAIGHHQQQGAIAP